jgi:hypothetical protein
VGDPSAALGEGGVDFGVGGIGIEVLLVPESEDGFFEGSGAVEAPFVLRNSLSEIELERADGGEGFADALAVFLEGGLVFRSVNDDLFGVGAIGGELGLGHFEKPPWIAWEAEVCPPGGR